ncbi:type II toxin-antitoxin system RelE/ParE family toxin [Streptococcus parasuis]
MEKYRVIISPRLIEQIKSIRDYVANVKLSPETAERLVTAIFDEIESLELFPERGFDVDEKIGVKIDKNGRSSRGITIQNGKYIVIYTVNQEAHSVEVAFLFLSKTDYAKLFR